MTPDRFDVPIAGITREQDRAFNQGDVLFGLQLRDYDGIGPLYTRASCGACHEEAARGPGSVQKMSIVEPDGVTPSLDQALLPFGHTVHPLVTAGAKTPIMPPDGVPNVRVSLRVGPPVLGRGYMEAIPDSEIARVAAEQAARTDEIHGRVNHVVYASEGNPDQRVHSHQKGDLVIGRFGLKARIATLDDFTADAMQGDMGITSPLRPEEFANPDGLVDDLKPGIDVTIESVNGRAEYMRLIAIPPRTAMTDEGRALFDRAQCSACHVSSMRTRDDYPLAVLAGKEAPIFSDLLLHDMGNALADGTGGIDGEATSRDWRTAPLIGLRFNKSFMHDGRSKTVEEAILAHESDGGEAQGSIDSFKHLLPTEQALLVAWVTAL